MKKKRKKKIAENPLPSVCPVCGMEYDDLKTGYTFGAVKDLMWRSAEDPSQWKYKRRHGVLGLWREIKQGLWRDHVEACEQGEYIKQDVEKLDQDEDDTSFDPADFDDDDFTEF